MKNPPHMKFDNWRSGIRAAISAAIWISVITAALIAGSACQKTPGPGASDGAPATAGAAVFEHYCSACHIPDSTENKLGPGLKGLFERSGLPVSGRPVTEAAIRNQLIRPFRSMPPFKSIPEDELKALLEYLRTL
jgi:mono/diheme cytochrome c family protein